jgi:Mor family transcriptional regulator
MSEAREIPQDIDPSRLPASLTEIIEVIGLAPALRLVEQRGGTEIWIPKCLTKDHYLCALLGNSIALRLVQRYALSHMEIPNANRAICAMRDVEIRRRRGRQTVRELAQEFQLTERRIWQILSSP